jgi:hypothetical protein
MSKSEVTLRIAVEFCDFENLRFTLIADWGQRTFSLDSYAIKHYRGLGPRAIIEEVAKDWLEAADESAETIKFIFI